MASRRLVRVGEQLREELARALRADVADPRVRHVTVLRVDPSPDLRNALVFWSRLETPEGASLDEVAAGLASAAPYLRRRLAHDLSLKRMPELRFRHDPGIELGDQTLSLLRKLRDES
ncbi:30S ribosome-binding factor RbfA [Myxococcota bacterium]|nr:30S ribosome-binding factor RbfA [Myxococcota bacterium]MCZ7618656.1 30S ribosome-binding factor RbfA [Myxococcota bacterium]